MVSANITQNISVTKGTLEIKQPLFGELVNRETLGKRISWDANKFELVSAYMRVNADQDANAGASLTINHNDRPLTPIIRWHAFDTADKKPVFDLGSTMTNGENIFDFVYEVGGLNRLGATCKVDAMITLQFRQKTVEAGDGTPAEETRAEDQRTGEKALKWISDHLKLVAAIVIAGGVIGGVSYLYLKKQNFLLSIMGRFRR